MRIVEIKSFPFRKRNCLDSSQVIWSWLSLQNIVRVRTAKFGLEKAVLILGKQKVKTLLWKRKSMEVGYQVSIEVELNGQQEHHCCMHCHCLDSLADWKTQSRWYSIARGLRRLKWKRIPGIWFGWCSSQGKLARYYLCKHRNLGWDIEGTKGKEGICGNLRAGSFFCYGFYHGYRHSVNSSVRWMSFCSSVTIVQFADIICYNERERKEWRTRVWWFGLLLADRQLWRKPKVATAIIISGIPFTQLG